MLRTQVTAAWRTCGNSLSPWGHIELRSLYKDFKEQWEQLRGRRQEEEGRRNSEDEQEQDKASQQLALSASSGCNERTPASSLELDVLRVRSALGECGGAGKSGTAKDERKRHQSNSPSRRPMEEEDASLGNL